jgi:hypothetical protein
VNGNGCDNHALMNTSQMISATKLCKPCNQGACGDKDCGLFHLCAVCGSRRHGWNNSSNIDIGWSTCEYRFLCLGYSMGVCADNPECWRRHWCILCHENHRLGDIACKLFYERVSEYDYISSYCLDWNSDGCFESMECEDRHHCVFCSSSRHSSFECTHALQILMENGEVRESSALESSNLQTKYHCTASSFGFRSSIPPQPGSIGTNGVNRAASIPCYHFNRVKNGCDYETCTYIHVCAICGCDHGFYSCPRSDLCMEYTKTGACLDLNCKSRHWCILCHKMHPFGDPMCSLFSQL